MNHINPKWSEVYQTILSQKLGQRFLELSKEDLGLILESMELLTKYCLVSDSECEEIDKKLGRN
jgi:hypothetical protein